MIWFLRHGEAEDGTPDEERQLTEKGRRQSRAAGAGLAKVGVKPDACLSSPKRRALETAEIACEQLGIAVTIEPSLAGGPFDAERLAAGLGDVLLVGHEPDFSQAVRELTGGRVRIKKGGVVGVDSGELRGLMRPRDLAAIAD